MYPVRAAVLTYHMASKVVSVTIFPASKKEKKLEHKHS
jgi:hypothetical protein